jgi:4-amino-4-deoxy-L-arabinose transferase-like glycosyltransferase
MMASNSSDVKSGRTQERVNLWSHPFFLIGVIVFASLAVRLVALAHWGTGAIESEGTEYARIAQNLRNGTGYVGMSSPGAEIVFPQLFPWLIVATSFLTHDYEWAGRIICLIFQSLLPLPVFGIASRLYNRSTGLVAAMLTVFYPLLVNLSFAVLSEAIYITLLLSAVYIVLLALARPTIRMYILAGGMFGLAYLTRQEAVAPLLVALFLTICCTAGSLLSRTKYAAAALAMFAIVALPEVIHLYKATGHIRLEEKSSLFYAQQVRTAIGEQNNVAMPGEWAEHSINANLENTGTENRPEADVVRETHVKFRQLAHNIKLGVRRNVPTLLDQLTSRWMGAPFLPALALLGALRRPWKRSLVSSHLYLLLVPMTAVVATFSFSGWTALRYYFVLIPFLLIWAANGLVGVGSWTKASISAAGWNWISPVISRWVVPGLVALVVIVYPVKAVRSIWDFQHDSRGTQVIKQLGLWIAHQQDRQVMIMDRSTPLAFHANAQWVDFPYCDGDLALRFLDAAKVDYVILSQGEKYTEYYQDWVTNGIPDPRAERVYATSTPDGKITVFRWHREANP